ncbi:hypothetical protein KUTeg_008915 [Tegillarca granosa]|uniref:Uncharacterized protein n=1 Tax=Tegillarca granosa TaxID=220873 RepID=A0ABQ9FAG1_TEGGR|nr:hypothetical protein KUTeg_008915 [Tegillarca granosa]
MSSKELVTDWLGDIYAKFVSNEDTSRDYRLLTIRQNILRHLQWSSPPTTMDPEVRRQLMLNITREYSEEDWAGNQMVQYDEEEYLGSFNFPPQHSRSLWRRPPQGTLNMYFDLVESLYTDNQVVRNGTLKILMKSRNECLCNNDSDYDRILLYLHRYEEFLRRNRSNNRNRQNRRRGRGKTT